MRFWLGAAASVILTIALLVLSRDLLPPPRIVFAAGPAGGAYAEIAERYRELLAEDGIEVVVLETGGSIDNARLVADGKADFALLQGGIGGGGGIALATIFHEPLLVLARSERRIPGNVARWRDLRIAVGPPGSGSRAVFDDLARLAELSPGLNTLVPDDGAEASRKLMAGEVDAAVFVAPLGAPYLDEPLRSSEVTLVELDHIEALARRLAYARVATAPSGAFALDPAIPARDLLLMSFVARLISAPDPHPALVDRLIEAARTIHGGGTLLAADGAFPSTLGADLPVDPQARRLLSDGPSYFRAWLPYWISAQMDRVLILLVPLLVVLVPTLRSMPSIYAWRMKNRVWRHYRSIQTIEEELDQGAEPARLSEVEARLDEIDGLLAKIDLPSSYRSDAYEARLHVELVRRRIARRRGARADAQGAA